MIYIFNALIILLFFSSIALSQQKEIIAYYPEFRSKGQIFYVKDLERNGTVSKLTLINYAFVEPEPDSIGNIVPQFINSYSAYQEVYTQEKSIDGIPDDHNQPLRGQFNQLRRLKKKYPHLKILLSIGGWGGSKYFSDLALTDSSRKKFADVCIDWFIKGNLPVENNAGGKGSAAGLFDGFDLDWEFPIKGGLEGNHYNPNDRENHTALFALFRKKMDDINPNMLLTAAISARASEFWKYNFEKDQHYLDWYNVMTYDFHGSWESRTGHHTNLLSSPLDPDLEKNSLDNTIKFLLDSAGVRSSKIVPGAAFYGKSWLDVDSANLGLYQPGQPDTVWNRIRINNYLDFSAVINSGYQRHWDDLAMCAWLYNQEEKIFFTYDDICSIALKARYADAYDLRGLMFWEITGDDASGNLVNTIYNRNLPDVEMIGKIRDPISSPNILKPLSSSTFSAGSNIPLNINAEDITGIIKAEFFVDERSIGYNTIYPFSWIWFNAAEGEHKLSAVITVKDGALLISQPAKFSVKGK